MKVLEKLAREICWMEFADPKAVGTTKAIYWKRLPEFTKNNYLCDARRFVFVLGKLRSELLNDIERECIFRPEDWKL